MFKKLAIAAPIAMLALSTSMAFAAEPISTSINVRAFIPTDVFSAAPQNPEFGRDEVMTLQSNGELTSVDQIFALKHTATNGAINALIDGPASLYNGRDSIALTVTVGGIELSETSTEIVDETQSVPGVQRPLKIKAATPGPTQNGDYTAAFAVVFEPVLKP